MTTETVAYKGLGEITAERKRLSTQRLDADYNMLPQTQRNLEANGHAVDRLTDRIFLKACELAKIAPTRRQALKWNRKMGAAYAFRLQAQKEIAKKQEQEKAS